MNFILILISSYCCTISILFIARVKSPFYVSLSVILCSIGLGLFLILAGISWFFYSLVIIFLGGIIVVFVYASSLSNNFILLTSIKTIYFIIGGVLSFIIIFSTKLQRFSPFTCPPILFFGDTIRVVALLALVLLLVLFVVVKAVKVEDGAIKL